MPVDVIGALRGKILFEQGWNADPDMCRVVVGAFGQSAEQRKIDGTPPLPFVQIRARGGPRSANWTAEGLRRVDVFGFGKSYDEADALSQSVDDYLVKLYNYDWPRDPNDATMPAQLDDLTTRIQYLATESDGIDGIDDDTNLPFMFRSYIVAYADLTSP